MLVQRAYLECPIIKKLLIIIAGMVLFFAIGVLLSVPIHNWTAPLFPISGYDDENKFLMFVALVEWPLFLIIGGIIGNFIYKKWFFKTEHKNSSENKIKK